MLRGAGCLAPSLLTDARGCAASRSIRQSLASDNVAASLAAVTEQHRKSGLGGSARRLLPGRVGTSMD